MSGKGVFITGTDTEVGKTVAALQLINELKSIKKRVVGYKPVASDAKIIDGKLINQDAAMLMESSSIQFDYDVHNPFVYEPAISPNIAANLTQRPLSLATIQNNYNKIAKACDVVVVEGAGGWRSPLSDDHSAVDLVKLLNIPVVLVIELKLGCINHSLLTAEVMLQDEIKVLGWISNGPLHEVQAAEEVLHTLVQKMPIKQLGKMHKSRLNQDKCDFSELCQYF